MPTNAGKDSKGCFYRWGEQGHKYYYQCGDKTDANRAKDNASKQGRAIEVSKADYEKQNNWMKGYANLVNFLRKDDNYY